MDVVIQLIFIGIEIKRFDGRIGLAALSGGIVCGMG